MGVEVNDCRQSDCRLSGCRLSGCRQPPAETLRLRSIVGTSRSKVLCERPETNFVRLAMPGLPVVRSGEGRLELKGETPS